MAPPADPVWTADLESGDDLLLPQLRLGEARQRALLDRARPKIRRVFGTLTREAAQV